MRALLAALLSLLIPVTASAVEVGYSRNIGASIPNCSSPIGVSTVGGTGAYYAGSDAPYITNTGSSCIANQICMYTSSDGASPVNILLALYTSTTSTQPGSLLRETDVINLPGGTALGWQCGPITPITIEGGASYHLSWLADVGIAYRYDTGSNPVAYKTMTFANGHDDPYGTPGGNLTRNISMYLGHD